MKDEIANFLKKNSIQYKIIEHDKVNTCKEQAEKAGISEKAIAKSLIFKAEKEFILGVGPGNKSISRKFLGAFLKKELELASPKDVRRIADCDPGGVYPFGNLMKIQTYIDEALLKNKLIYFSPGSHNETIEIKTEDYIKYVKPTVVKMEEKIEKKQATLGLNVKKDENSSEWYTQIIQKAELADYSVVSGCIVFRPYSYQIWDNIKNFFDAKIRKSGVDNAYFPMFIPESLLMKEQEHVKGFTPEVAWVTHAGNTKLSERLAVRPTSETIMYDSYSKWIRSYNDLPLRINQWNSVVRWEFKHAIPFLRTREFLWQEGHTVFATKKEAADEVLEILDYYAQVFEDLLAIPVIKGKKTASEKFAGALYSTTVETFLPVKKAIQGATSHCLGQNFAKAFDINFVDNDGETKLVWQNSWGLSTRSIGIMILMHGDDKGLVLPPKVAPITAVIIPILFDKTKDKILKKAEELKMVLSDYNIKLDSRADYTPGWKFNEWELKGVPLRIEIGPKDLENEQVMIARRDTGEKTAVKWKDLKKGVDKLLQDIHENLYNRANTHLKENTKSVKDWNEFMKAAEDKKWIKANHCGNAECEASIKEKSNGLKTNCIPFDQPKKLGKCVLCGKDAEYEVLFAKSY